MSLTSEKFNGQRYEIVAWARDEQTLIYHEFGSYQGEWICVSADKDSTYRIYKGYYGSCSGCDSYEASDIGHETTRERALEFAKDYPSFVEIPRRTMCNLAKKGTLKQVFPANTRDEFSDIPLDDIVTDVQTLVKVREKLALTVSDVLAAKNQEIKREALDAYGHEQFRTDAKGQVLDTDGGNELLKFGENEFYAYVKDASTPRRYLLRVPPETTRVRAGVAWTFGLTEADYIPEVET